MTDRQLLRFAADFRRGILDGRAPHGMCIAVCWPLASLLLLHGIAAMMEEVRFPRHPVTANHAWLRLPDRRILDPTADQWNEEAMRRKPLPPVYLGKVPAIYRRWMQEAR